MHDIFAKCKIPLIDLIKKQSLQDSMKLLNITIDKTCTLISSSDNKMQLGILKYKMKMRKPLDEAIKWIDEVNIMEKTLDAYKYLMPEGPNRDITITISRLRLSDE